MPWKRSESLSWSGQQLLLLACLVIGATGQEDILPVNSGLNEFSSSVGSSKSSNPYKKWRSRKRRSVGSKFHPPVQEGRMSISNMTCDFFEQPLNHFVPRGKSPNYRQRYCINSDYAIDSNSPIFFYTGNESPLEQYINHTGLMWELAPTFQVRVFRFLAVPLALKVFLPCSMTDTPRLITLLFVYIFRLELSLLNIATRASPFRSCPRIACPTPLPFKHSPITPTFCDCSTRAIRRLLLPLVVAMAAC